jgi:hypothetical protein
MTTYERGDIVEASDPFRDDNPSRPFCLISTAEHPFHGEQYVTLTLTTKSWYDETIPVDADDFSEGSVPEKSALVPWGIVSPAHGDITNWFGRLEQPVVDAAVEQLVGYLGQ